MSIVLIPNGNTRVVSSSVTVYSGKGLVFNLTYSGELPANMQPLKIERKNSENKFKPYSLNDGIFAILDADSTSVTINVPGEYRVVRPSQVNFNANVGVSYDVGYDAIDPVQPLSYERSQKDGNGIYKTIEFFRPDGSLAKTSVLSGGTSPTYTTRTETWYDLDGETVLSETVYDLSYSSGELISETIQGGV